ncbi:MAG: hypothetical protein ACK43K_01905 [Chitinophagales bacterium]|nr:hypothetical protein [Sphingobacteriales bacterium]
MENNGMNPKSFATIVGRTSTAVANYIRAVAITTKAVACINNAVGITKQNRLDYLVCNIGLTKP